jgi:hypothetical protein
MLLYGSLLLIALFAFGGLLIMLRGGGDIRRRFRDEPLIGLLGLTSCYLVASIPSDQLWHAIYGTDITAWSLPHLLLIGGFVLVMLAAVALQLSPAPLAPWRGLRGIREHEVPALLLIVCVTVQLLQFGTTEWEGITTPSGVGPFWERPEWLYPVVAVSIALFCGTFTLHALRLVGAASLVALLALGFRAGTLALLQADANQIGLGYAAQLIVLPPMLALDLWYAVRLRRSEAPETLVGGNLLAGVVFLAFGLPLISRMMVYPRINGATLPGMIVGVLLAALAAGWIGARLGAWLGALDRPATSSAPVSPLANWIAIGALVAVAVFATIYMLTASPPIAV